MVFRGFYARTPFAMVISLPCTLGQEWLRLRCRSSPPSREPPCFDREPHAARRGGDLSDGHLGRRFGASG